MGLVSRGRQRALVDQVGTIRTVLGDIAAQDAGITLIHEHLYMDMSPMVRAHEYQADPAHGERPFDIRVAGECRWNPGAHPANYRFDEREAVLEDLLDAHDLGVRTVVDATPRDIGRNPKALQALARGSGLNVVMGTGYYLAPSHRSFVSATGAEAQTHEEILVECELGVDGVRPGIIGEIGTSDPPAPSELGVLRGAARAARETGLPLSVHVHPWGLHGLQAAETALGQGVEPSRIILNHMSTAVEHPRYLRDLLSLGVTLSFDLFGFDHSLLGPGRYAPSDDVVAACVVELVRGGWLHGVVISQDVGVLTRLRRYGGWGYGHLLRHVVPLLLSKGLSDAEVDVMLRTNPARLLAVAGEELDERAGESVGDANGLDGEQKLA